MTVFFRPFGDLSRAPEPCSDRDDTLRDRISAATGVTIEIDPDVDYEDWTEPMTLLDAAIARGVEIAILPRKPLAEAVIDPLVLIPGESCPNILLGRQTQMDPHNLPQMSFSWPPRGDARANHYGELAAFHAAAGRRLVLADMLGDPELGRAREMIGEVSPVSAGAALSRFSGEACLVKQVFPCKLLGPFTLDIPTDADEAVAERALLDEIGLHFARFEGEKGALLIQEHVTMTHETRFFVVNGTVICGAACIEDHTPQVNTDGDILRPVFEVRRNSGEILTDPDAAKKLLAAARHIAQEIVSEDPALRSFVLDLALGADGAPLAIELNPIGSSGLYGIDASRLIDAILTA